MSSLPASLAPWAEQLNLFPPLLGAALGDAVRRLALALGPLRPRDVADGGAPDGYSGLSRRGSYERLLTSEWLLAEEAPDEFIRRASTREHAFFALAHRSPSRARRSIVLFDAGPEQLGTPRIAHLALLIVLARRAAEAGATLGWGVLQDPVGPPHSEVDAAAIERLLGARSPYTATETELTRWRQSLVGHALEDDLWLVGGAGTPTGAPSRIVIDDALASDGRSLRVEVSPARRPRRELSLPLPAGALCARLLRDPFEAHQPKPGGQLPSGVTDVRLSGNGRWLLAITASDGVLCYSVPNSPRRSIGAPRKFALPTQERLVALGATGKKRQVLLTRAEGDAPHLIFRGHRSLLVGGDVRFAVPTGQFKEPESVGPAFVLRNSGAEGNTVAFLDEEATLFLRHTPTRVATPILSSVTAVHGDLDQLRLVQAATHSGPNATVVHRLVRLVMQGGVWVLSDVQPLPDGDGDLRAFFGPSRLTGNLSVVVRCWARKWLVLTGDARRELAPPEGTEVVGVIDESLVLLEQDRRTVTLMGREGSEKLFHASGKLLRVSCAATLPYIAALTEHGELTVHQRGRLLMQLLPMEPR